MKARTTVYMWATVHWLILVLVAIADVYVLIYEPWYMSIIVIGVCFRFIFSGEHCPITEWEERARKKAGMSLMDHKFLKFYVSKLLVRLK